MKISPVIEKDLISWCKEAAAQCRENDPDVGIFPNEEMAEAFDGLANLVEDIAQVGDDVVPVITNGTIRMIPKDEPIFLLRGQDKYAARAVRFWADLVDMDTNGSTPAIAKTARAHADKMAAWEPRKTPDLPR